MDTKILKKVILDQVARSTDHDKYHFGFKASHSTTLGAGVVKQAVDYYVSRGSHVFACFVDFRKAFDNVNCWKLFNYCWTMDVDGVDVGLVQLLAYWYPHREVTVVWLNTRSFCY